MAGRQSVDRDDVGVRALQPPAGVRTPGRRPPRAPDADCSFVPTRTTSPATTVLRHRPSGNPLIVPILSPASNGSVHIFSNASRALLACRDVMPGSPELSASRRSRHSSARTSPTMMREGRMRRLSLTRSRSLISPVPSRPFWRVCNATQSGWLKRNSKTSSAEITRSPPGILAARQLSIVVLPACVPPATTMLRPARTEASRNCAAWSVRLPSSTRSCSLTARTTNLRMLTAVKVTPGQASPSH